LTGSVQCISGIPYFALLDHTSHDQVGNTAVLQDAAVNATGIETYSVVIKITGLTPSDTYQYDWAGIGSGATLSMFCQGAQGIPGTTYAGPATMEVWSA
jgi:hypothetical protein